MSKKKTPSSEANFRKWYAGHASRLRINPDPDAPQHYYDYRAAYRAGAKPDASGHWPSQFKRTGHPRMVIGGVNTKTGRSVMPRKRTSGARAIQEAKARRTPASMARASAEIKLQAGRRATAKRLSEQKATTQAQLRARKTPKKPKPGGLRGLVEIILGGKKKLEGALKPKQ